MDIAGMIPGISPAAIYRNLRTPGSGMEALPKKARTARDLMIRHDVRNYRTTDTIKRDDELFQRIVEGSWPKRYSADATHLILLESDPVPAPCILLKTKDGVSLATCQ